MAWAWTEYEISDSRTERELRKLIGDFSCTRNPLRVLDFGCGAGVRAQSIVTYSWPSSVELRLFDTDEALLESACRRTSGTPSRLDDGPFDLIVCFSVFELFPDEQIEGTLEMFARLLARNGLLLVQHAKWHPLAARTIYWRLHSPFRPASQTHAVHRFPRNYGSVRALLTLCEQSGFRVSRIIRGPYHSFLYLPTCPLAATSFNIFAFGRAADNHNESCLDGLG